MTEPRTVWAVDVTTSVISLAKMTESDPPTRPAIGRVIPTAVATHSPYSTWHHAKAAAAQVVETITKDGEPTLVVMAKNFWLTADRDPSTERRFRLYNAVEDRLFAAGIPVAEFPYATTAKWLVGHTPRGKETQVMSRLELAAKELWDITPPTKLNSEGKPMRVPFRVPVACLSAVGATAVGIVVPDVEVTEARLQIMSGKETALLKGNASIQWPRDLKLPHDLKGWERLRKNPEKLWVKHRDSDEDTDAA